MAKDNGTATEATAETPATEEAATRNRAPTPFKPQSRITVSVHQDVLTEIGEAATVAAVSAAIAQAFDADKFSTRITSRKRTTEREPGAPDPIPSGMVYVAVKGYEFPSDAQRGVRVSAEDLAEIRAAQDALLKSTGGEPGSMDLTDPKQLAQFLRNLAAKGASA